MHPFSESRGRRNFQTRTLRRYWFNIRDSRFLDNPTWNSFERIEEREGRERYYKGGNEWRRSDFCRLRQRRGEDRYYFLPRQILDSTDIRISQITRDSLTLFQSFCRKDHFLRYIRPDVFPIGNRTIRLESRQREIDNALELRKRIFQSAYA